MPRTSTKPRARLAVGGVAPGYRLDDQLGFQLRRAYQRASANLQARIAAFDITTPQFATLARLYEHGSISQNLLGRLVVMEPANIRDVVQRLKKRGLVEARRHAHDKRLILLSLSAAGRTLFKRLQPLETESTAETLAPLNTGERRLLLDLLRRLGDSSRSP
jgi:MarR family transcriptional regulator, lower aerobic nicotinate degradation pathway regulator